MSNDSWQWPEWLTAPYIAMDRDGEWMAHCVKPRPHIDIWIGYMVFSLTGFTNFVPPPCDDWTKSLRKNPNAKSTV